MNKAIEIHDSKFRSISFNGDTAIVHFAAIYLHQSAGEPGVDPGTVWCQEAKLYIREAVVKGELELGRENNGQVGLSDGYIKLDGEVHNNTIPVPLDSAAPFELNLRSFGNETITVYGVGAWMELIGEPVYVEEF